MKINENALSRRSFLQGAALTSMALGAAGLYGCSSPTAPLAESGSNDTANGSSAWTIEELGEPAETLTADVCVIGGGGTGMAAALQAKQLGLDVLLIEKNPELGGCFAGTEGMFAVGTQWQKDAGVALDADEMLAKAMEFHHYVPSQELYRSFFNRSADNIEWCEDLGIKYAAVITMGASDCCWHIYEGAPTPGHQFVENMIKAVEAHELRVETGLAGKRLLMADDTVAGLLAERTDGTVVQIDCPTVIIGTGGYSNNPDLVREFGNDPERVVSMLDNGRTGDGIKMAKNVGAALATSPGTLMTGGPTVRNTAFGSSMALACCMQPIIWVNEHGQRFIREDMFDRNFSSAGQASIQQGRVLGFVNQALVNRFEKGEGALVPAGTYVFAGAPMTGLSEELETLMESGIVVKGDTVQEVAGALDLDGEALQAMLDHYNELCAAGKDSDMFKDPSYMIPMEEGPYYLLDCVVTYLTTVGGLKVSPLAEVLNEEGDPIRGLYAGGCDAGGLYGDTYDVMVAPGSQAAWCIYTGRVAAEQAAAYIA